MNAMRRTANGLNQLTSIGGSATAHDARGNLISDPTSGKTYAYSSENLLISSTGGTSATLAYDPMLRLHQVAGGATTRFAYDGLAMIAEYDGANTLQRRYVHGPGIDEPLVQYEGGGTSDRRFLHADERGSIVAVSDGSGAMLNINKYDEFGKPQSGNSGRFQYTGQMWLGELGLHYYKARMYAPHLGRFLQTDPIGYWDSPNLYAYVGNSPIDFTDPFGLDHSRASDSAPARSCTGTLLCSAGQAFGPGTFGHSTGGVGGELGMTVGEAYQFAEAWAGSHGITDRATINAAVNYLTYQGSLGQVGAALINSGYGAFNMSGGEGGDHLCAIACTESRSLLLDEKVFYVLQGLPLSVVDNAVLHEGLPAMPYLWGANGYTLYNDVFLRFDINNILGNPWRAGVLGEELYHVWQYQQGATPLQFAYYQQRYGHDNSPLEIPAMAFGRSIQSCLEAKEC